MIRSFIIAFVGMPGAGKSLATEYIKQKNYPVIRFGDFTEEKLQELNLVLSPKNEEKVRESLREEFGMAAYAIHAVPKIQDLLTRHQIIVIDGLYSWEEYLFLKKNFAHLVLIHIYAEPAKRYQRLAHRPIRPFTKEEARIRDTREIEHLNKGGPIAMADYLIDNNGYEESLYKKIDGLLEKIK